MNILNGKHAYRFIDFVPFVIKSGDVVISHNRQLSLYMTKPGTILMQFRESSFVNSLEYTQVRE